MQTLEKVFGAFLATSSMAGAEVALRAVEEESGLALQFAAAALRSDRAFLLQACALDGFALKSRGCGGGGKKELIALRRIAQGFYEKIFLTESGRSVAGYFSTL